MVIGPNIWEHFFLNLDPSTYGCHNFFGRGNLTLLICHVTSRDHVKKVSDDLLGETCLLCHHSAKFVGDRSSRRGDIKFLIRFVISCYNVIIAHLTLGWEPLTLSNHWPSLMLAGLDEVETQIFYFFTQHHVTA